MLEIDDIAAQVKLFPSSFDLDIQHMKTRHAKDILSKLLRECEYGYETVEEKVRTWNLLSFLYWFVKDDERALEYNSKVCDTTDSVRNIICLSNKIHFCLKKENCYEASIALTELKQLEKTSDYTDLTDTARSELAFSYARFGPKYYDKCINLLEELVGRHPDKYLWKYGLGLVYRRILNCNSGSFSKIKVDFKHVFDFLHDVANNAKEGTVLKAHGWVGLGELVYIRNRNTDLKETTPSGWVSDLDETSYFEKALEYGKQDPFVLERCGKYFRYFRDRMDFSRSKELLEQSIKLRPSSFNCHHYALTIKMMESHALGEKGVDGFRAPRRSRRVYSTSSRYISNDGSQTSSRHSPDNNLPHVDSQLSSSSNHGISDISKQFAAMGIYTQNMNQLQRLLKSPLKIPKAPGNTQFLLALKYLKKSIELGDNNNMARLDLGMLYVNLEEYDDALNTFKEVLDTRRRHYSAIEAVKSYEQQGLCMQEMSELPKYKERRESLMCNAKMCFYRALEHVAAFVAKYPNVYSNWHSFSTLKTLLTTSNEITEKQKFADIAGLCELIQRHEDAIDFYKKILSLDDDQGTNQEVYSKLVRNYLELSDFDNAVLFLRLWNCTHKKESFSQLYVQSHLDGAIHKLKAGDDVTATQWYYNAFLFVHDENNNDDDDTYHVAIFNEIDQHMDGMPKDITECLERFNLNVTRNDEDISPVETTLTGYIRILKESGHIILVLQRNERSGEFQYIIDHAIRLNCEDRLKHPILVITDGDSMIPEVLASVPHLQYCRTTCGADASTSSHWLEALMSSLVTHNIKRIL